MCSARDEVRGRIKLMSVVVFCMFEEGLVGSLYCMFHGCSMCNEVGVCLLEGDGTLNEVLFSL